MVSSLRVRSPAPPPISATLRSHARPLPKDSSALARYAAGAPMVQMLKALVNVPWMQKTGKWDAHMQNGKMESMEAAGLKLVAGKKIGAKVNLATAKPSSWTQLQNWHLVHAKPPRYVRMHMLNARLGGPGNLKDNLAPGTHDLNQQHRHRVESPLIKALNAGGEVYEYGVTALYQNGGGHLQSPKAKMVWNDTLDRLICTASYQPAPGVAKQKLIETLSEQPDITKKPNWKGH